MQRVVITGLGLLTPIGAGKEVFWKSLLEGANGIVPVESFDTSDYPVHLGAEVKGFEPGHYLKRHRPEDVGRASQLALAAAHLAVQDTGRAQELSCYPRWSGTFSGSIRI